ncbi:clathrin adaptor complex small chain subfamily protein [Besnoitia besnoiti]|uniref:Coatomer subunit zeta n=1 Tax=Besnoitia besnoiti TaxID=94643 RepID=A0A2A9MKV1_BESBE|nr:clathrin adaptor complex small chain subfamily protein [Besnoitia besnoiti]PFH36060.1 clathrin adaptor complex small chain subfamily protein [Besnoitia besnoiti]
MASIRVSGVAILDSEGERLAVKYSRTVSPSRAQAQETKARRDGDVKDFASQRQLEQQLVQRFAKLVGRNEVEAFEVGEYVALGQSMNDVLLFLVAEDGANEILLLEVFNTLTSVLTSLTNGQVGKKQILDNLDVVFLMLDEVFDNGLVLQLDPGVVLARIHMQDDETAVSSAGAGGEAPSAQTAFNQAISSAKENLIRSLLSGGP